MNKSILIAAALLTLAGCQKNKTEVKAQDTIIEGRKDTVRVDTDTVAESAEPMEKQ